MTHHLSIPSTLWLAHLHNQFLSHDTHTLGLTVRSVLDDISAHNFTDMDNKLASVDVSLAPVSHLLAVISSLLTWQHALRQWSPLRDRAYQYCIDNNIHGTDNAFKGLF